MSNTPIIEIEQLTKTFRHATEPAVKGISFAINRNEIFGLLGPNGAGKTTTISILCGLFPPTSGKVMINGQDFQTHSTEIRQMIGIVPQDIALYPTLNARENLEFYGSMYGLYGRELRNSINDWLNKLGLTDAAKRKLSTYSGGMKRRVNLIAGILHKPSILFLDEPTVGVDVHSRNVIIQHLKEINAQGTTIIYTSHHMEEAETFCTRVSIIDQGKILTQGTPAELINNHPGAPNLETVFLNLTKRKLRD